MGLSTQGVSPPMPRGLPLAVWPMGYTRVTTESVLTWHSTPSIFFRYSIRTPRFMPALSKRVMSQLSRTRSPPNLAQSPSSGSKMALTGLTRTHWASRLAPMLVAASKSWPETQPLNMPSRAA